MGIRPRIVALIAAVVLVGFGIVLAVQHRREPSVPRLVQQHGAAPEFTVPLLDGSELDSNSLQGKTYVVNFFNSWCIPCHQEEPALKAFYAAHKNEADFEMIGIVRDDEETAIRNYVRNREIDWTVAFDPKGSAALGFGTTGQPETYVIAPDGVAVCGALGPSTQAELETWLTAARTGKQCE
jgi:cytochrome c biogenesis protein CcmG, thiol:disulfide interchange protein DsbE